MSRALVGWAFEHWLWLVAGGFTWMLAGSAAAVGIGRMIALAEYEDLADPEPRRLRVVR